MLTTLLVVDPDATRRENLVVALSGEERTVIGTPDAAGAFALLASHGIAAAFVDSGVPGREDFDLVTQIRREHPGLPIVLTGALDAESLAQAAWVRGAHDHLASPAAPATLALLLRRLAEQAKRRAAAELVALDTLRSRCERAIVAASDSMIALLEQIERIGPYDATILLQGEQGTGKEVLARAIHGQSARRDAPFVAVDCGVLPDERLELELFGQAGTARSQDTPARRGRIAAAHGGTLYLDEIAALSPALQVRIVQLIQESAVRPIGEAKSSPVDVRIVAATRRNVEVEVAEGRLRADLVARLDVVRLAVPPLRERRQDIPLLVDHQLAQLRETRAKNVRRVSDQALDRLMAHDWPANLRELEIAVEWAFLRTQGDVIEVAALPAELQRASASPREGADGVASTPELSMRRARRGFETDLIRRALARTGGNRTHAARLLEISHRALLYKLKDYGIRD